MWAHLDLEVLLLVAEEKDLNHLEVPQPPELARRSVWRRVSMVGGVDDDFDVLGEIDLDPDMFSGVDGLPAPGSGDGCFHGYILCHGRHVIFN